MSEEKQRTQAQNREIPSHVFRLTTDREVEIFNQQLSSLRLSGSNPRVKFVDGRTLDQNSMIYAVYKQVALQKDDESLVDIRRHCKAYYGIPILLAEDEAFSSMYRKGIMPNLTTEEKLEAMDVLPVTRRFNKKQATEYIDTMIREYSRQGISLINPAEVDSYGN